MAKKKIIRKSNRTLNLFADGGAIKQTLGQQSLGQLKNSFKKENIVGSISDIGSSVGTMVNAGLSNAQIADTSGIESNIQSANTYQVGANTNDSLMEEWGAFSPMQKVSWKDIRGGNTGQQISNTVGALGSGAKTGSSIGGPIGGIIGGAAGLISGIAGIFGGNRKAKRKAKALNNQINAANERNLVSLEDRASNIDTQNDLKMLANFSAFGGPIDTGGALNYEMSNMYLNNKELDTMSKLKINALPNSFESEVNEFSKGGGIHIKEANKGKFTKYCGGKVTSECIAKGKRSNNPAVRKRATFAANARKWHHANGGYLFDEGGNLYTSIPNRGQHGGDFSNGVTVIGNGGTHEENPIQGVPMGMDEQGIPNLVEEGEVKFNDYIFSNRIFADKDILELHNLPTSYSDHSFADIAERLSKESEERPNDPISKRGLMSSMIKLQQAQEELKSLEENSKTPNNQFAYGGYPSNIYDTTLLGDPIDIEAEMRNSDNLPTSQNSSRQGFDASMLRYAPVVGSGINTFTDLIGLTNKPDYENSDLIGKAVEHLPNIEFNPVGNYLSYNPLDRNYYLNKLNAQAGATRRAMIEQSGGNRATAMAGLLAADYNAQGQVGNLARQAEEYNQAQKERVEGFNRQTNMFNSEMGVKTAIANQQNNELRLKAKMAQAQMREQENARSGAARSANLTNFFDSLGEIGREEFGRNMIESNPALYYSIDNKGNITYKNGYNSLSDEDKKAVKKDAAKKSKKKSKGGYLTIRGGK